VSGEEPTIDFVLPGTWWRIALDSEETVQRSAQAMSRNWLGRSDELASVRAELSARVAKAAETARLANGQDFYLSRELMSGVGVPLSLAVYWPVLPVGPSRAGHPRSAAEALAATLRGTADAGEVEILDCDGYGVVRVVHEQQQAEEVITDDDLGRLLISYWVLNPASSRTPLLSFSTPLVPLKDEIVALGDAVVSTVSWRGGDASETTRRGPAQLQPAPPG
jgi:hypothetical protein